MSGPTVNLQALLASMGIHCDVDVELSGLCLDSRRVRPGDAFVAVSGETIDGLRFARQAVEAGALAVLHDSDDADLCKDLGVAVVRIADLRSRLGSLADQFNDRPSAQLSVIGVTGTNGKSSCVHFMAQSLHADGQRAGTVGTLGWGQFGQEQAASHTTPDALQVHAQLAEMLRQGAGVVAMEVSSHALDQGRVAEVRFESAVFTNLTRDHLDYHGDMNAYGRAKARLFSSPGLRFAILNVDDPASRTMKEAVGPKVKCIHYGIRGGDIRAEAIELEDAGLRFRLVAPDGRATVKAGLLGRFNVYNLLAVASVLHSMGWSVNRIAAALDRLQPVPGRMNRVGGGPMPLVVVDYAHTPDALAEALDAMREHVRGQLICVFGCGGERDRGKRPLMARAAAQRADRIVVTDDNPRTEDGDRIVADVMTGFESTDKVVVIRDRRQAIDHAVTLADRDDAILFAGKGHEDYQEIDGQRHPFDDREAARAALEACA